MFISLKEFIRGNIFHQINNKINCFKNAVYF